MTFKELTRNLYEGGKQFWSDLTGAVWYGNVPAYMVRAQKGEEKAEVRDVRRDYLLSVAWLGLMALWDGLQFFGILPLPTTAGTFLRIYSAAQFPIDMAELFLKITAYNLPNNPLVKWVYNKLDYLEDVDREYPPAIVFTTITTPFKPYIETGLAKFREITTPLYNAIRKMLENLFGYTKELYGRTRYRRKPVLGIDSYSFVGVM